MEAAVSKTNAFALANDLGDDADSWPGNKVVLSTSLGQTPNGMGHIMHMRGILSGQQPVRECFRRSRSRRRATVPATPTPLHRSRRSGSGLCRFLRRTPSRGQLPSTRGMTRSPSDG